MRDVCRRILGPLGVPVVFGAPVGHTNRPMLTLPLGVRARLRAAGAGKLEILEAAGEIVFPPRALEDPLGGGNHFLADSIAGDHCNF